MKSKIWAAMASNLSGRLMKNAFGLTILLSLAVSMNAARAGVTLFNIDTDPAGWAAAISGLPPTTAYDFNIDPPYSLLPFDGPLTSAGAGPVSPGILSPGVVMERVNNGGGAPGLVAVGPGFGFGNTSNWVGTNYSPDAFTVLSLPGGQVAFAGNFISLLGGATLTFTVRDSNNISITLPGNPGPGRYGFIADGGVTLAEIQVFDPIGGFEGVQGAGIMYTRTKTLDENLACASDGINALMQPAITGPAQKSLLINMLGLVTRYKDTPYKSLAVNALNTVTIRTDGCALRTTPDTVLTHGGAGMDFVTSCPAQAAIYACLKGAEGQLAGP